MVTEVIPCTLPTGLASPGDTRIATGVRLLSLGEDSMGEELLVTWELEPGRMRLDEGLGSLPSAPERSTDFDHPSDLAAFLDAMRWGAVSSVDPRAVQSPFRSGVTMEDYQLEPVVRAIRMPRANLLIADDVGLGKTIEAGLVAQELLTRHRIQQVLIVCPAGLLVKWQEEMRDKFGLDFVIADTQLMKRLRRERGPHVNPWAHYPRLITSMDWIKREGRGGPLQKFRETLPGPGDPLYPRRYGLLIVDEAHNVAPSGTGKYAVDSQRTAAIRTLAPHFEHKLFLTATPHNGKRESYSALLNLLDDQRFARGLRELDPKQVEAVEVRRLKTDLTDANGDPRFRPRQVIPLEVAYSKADKDLYCQLVKYGKLLRAARKGGHRAPGEFVMEILKKRFLSSPQAFSITLEKHRRTLRGISDDEGRSRRKRPDPGVLERFAEGADQGFSIDEEYEEQQLGMVGLATSMFDDLPADTRKLLREMADAAERATVRPDAKARRLIEFIDRTCRPDGAWNEERIIVFTEYRATQKWLIAHLAEVGIRDREHLRVLYGGMDPEERETIKAEFQAHPSESAVRVLLATDMASEGIDLQNHCHRMVHYEIPWNPSVLEQRNGRIDRHGQDHAPLVHHFVARASGEGEEDEEVLEADQEFLAKIVAKLEEQSTDLRGKVNPVIAAQVRERMAGDRRDLELKEYGPEPRSAARVLAARRRITEEVEGLRDRLTRSREELNVHPAAVRRVVELGLRLAGQPRLRDAELEGIWPDPSGERSDPPAFGMPALRDGWAACTRGISHPLTGKDRPITFDHEVARKRDNVVLAHLNHPLVRMCQFLLRAEADAAEGRGKLRRVSARVVGPDEVEGPTAVIWGRLIVLGGDGHRLHEELLSAAVRLRDGRMRRIDSVGEVDRIARLDGAEANTPVLDALITTWSSFSGPLAGAFEARVAQRTENLDSIVQRRSDEEARKVRAIFEELQLQISTELKSREAYQAELDFGDTRADQMAQDQFLRDSDSLREELGRIPERIAQEVEQVERRFQDPRPRSFPVAIEFLVPAGWRGN